METITAYQAWQREHISTSDRHYVEFLLDPRHAGPVKKPLAT